MFSTWQPIYLRPAQNSDILRLTDIIISSFPADPEWVYRYPYAAQFPEDHYQYSLQRFGEYFTNVSRGGAEIMVAEIDSEAGSEQASDLERSDSGMVPARKRVIIGWCCWALPGSHGTQDGDPAREMVWPSPTLERRDANPAHVKAYFDAVHDRKTSLFDDIYGEAQAHLCLLGVDPAYQGRGAGAALVQDGIDKAKAARYFLTLFATGPLGRRLYKKLGFREIAWIKVGPAEGDSEVLEFPAMVWDRI